MSLSSFYSSTSFSFNHILTFVLPIFLFSLCHFSFLFYSSLLSVCLHKRKGRMKTISGVYKIYPSNLIFGIWSSCDTAIWIKPFSRSLQKGRNGTFLLKNTLLYYKWRISQQQQYLFSCLVYLLCVCVCVWQR